MSVVDRILIVLGFLSLFTGLVGSVAPILPGPAISMLGLMLIQWTTRYQFSRNWVIVFAVLVVMSMIVDYYLPIWGTKKYGGTRPGMIGSTIGMVVGIFSFPPLGMVIMPMIGAFLGEYMVSKAHGRAALRSARGSFVGFLVGTGYKLILCGWMLVWVIQQIW